MYSLLLLLYIVNAVNCHGYLSWPAARQYKCYRDNNFWWPETGENIPDDACREAYQTVYAKYRNVGESHGLAANAAQYMFQQYYEYAAIAGPNYEDLEHVKENVVSSNLCAAGAHDRTHNFGDKSGIDVPLPNWRPDVLYHRNTPVDRLPIEISFCPTTVHEPSYFEVFITKPEFEYDHELSWDDLEQLPLDRQSSLVDNSGTDESCTNSQIYKIPVSIPWRTKQFIIFVRWQRNDVVGEGFYNCADVVFDQFALKHRSFNRKGRIQHSKHDRDEF
ncbi:gp37 [Erannis ankeraria nucleopolyhedrovirus]|uniref:gp37 n=1 Tax=Erannis ankeraria nucleopolyhedrovirus TaxID=2913600 RepID=UPI00117B48E2|nr:gp37 [Erannis ankeraria nucleopolyhedrovirus]UJZ89039.1 gp37 [Erannis ankeraria nucleopolyhedrovirus]